MFVTSECHSFKFERPEVLFSEATPLVYEVYLGLNRLGPTRDEAVSKTGVRDRCHFYTLTFTTFFFLFQLPAGDLSRTFLVPLEEDMIKTYLRVYTYNITLICGFHIFNNHRNVPNRFAHTSFVTFQATGVTRWKSSS